MKNKILCDRKAENYLQEIHVLDRALALYRKAFALISLFLSRRTVSVYSQNIKRMKGLKGLLSLDTRGIDYVQEFLLEKLRNLSIKTYLNQKTKLQYGFNWARIINDGYLRGLSSEKMLPLAEILAVPCF